MKKSLDFLTLCHESINPGVTREDVREMIIQHILTRNIFYYVYAVWTITLERWEPLADD